MNKRLPLLLSLLAVIVLAASLAYWILQLYQPPQRPLAAAPVATMPDPSADAAATLFGGQAAVATTTNYQLTGVISAGRNSVAIIVADGAPPKALQVGRELAPGVTVAEVYPRYVMLSDGGIMKRIDLAPDSKPPAPMDGMPQANMAGPGNAPPSMPQNMPQGMQQGMPPGAVMTPITPAGTPPPPPPNEQQTPMAPGAVMQQQQPQSEPPPANPNTAPAQGPAPANAPQEPTTNAQ